MVETVAKVEFKDGSEARYGKNHKVGMEVPAGGSNCAKCKHVSEDGKRCDDDEFQAWQASKGIENPEVIPADSPDVYCCDYFKAKPELVTLSGRNDMAHYEQRQYASSELRAQGGDGHSPLTLTGYAATFEGRAQIGGPKGYTERINAGAFKRALTERQDVTCRFNHDPSFILGRTSAGTLKLNSDAKGLWFECLLPETQQARDLHTSVQRGDIHECSFGFSLPLDGGEKWSVERNADGKAIAIRELLDVNLHDVSAVTEPAYSNTKVFARAEGDVLPIEIRSALDAEEVVVPVVEAKVEDAIVAETILEKREEEPKVADAPGAGSGPTDNAVVRDKSDDDDDEWEYNSADPMCDGMSEEEWNSLNNDVRAEKKAAALKKAMRSNDETVQAQETDRLADASRYAEAIRVSMEAGLPAPAVTEARFSDNPAHAVNHGQHAAASEYHTKRAEAHASKGETKAADLHTKAAAAHQAVVDGKLSGASDESKAARSASVEAAEESKRCGCM